jgi:hypothetical protein
MKWQIAACRSRAGRQRRSGNAGPHKVCSARIKTAQVVGSHATTLAALQHTAAAHLCEIFVKAETSVSHRGFSN